MRHVLFALAAVFVLIGGASLLSVFMMPWLLAYGFSAPAALSLVLGGVLLLALAALLDGLRRVESAIYGLQQSLRSLSAQQAPAMAGPQAGSPVQAPVSSVRMAESPQSAAPSAMASPPGKSAARPVMAPGGRAQSGTVQAASAEPPQPMVTADKQVVRERAADGPGAKTAREWKEKPAGAKGSGEQATVQKDLLKTSPQEEMKTEAPAATVAKGEEMPQPASASEAKPQPKQEEVAEGVATKEETGKDEATPVAEKGAGALLEETLPPAQEEPAGEERYGEGGFLYIVREEVVRGRRARVLSDGTIEAELDEGWLRFENMDHLNEYLDALEELRKKGML